MAFGLPDCYRLRGTSLTPSEFSQLLDGQRKILCIADVERALLNESPLPPGTVLTFDDGYQEHLARVVPMLVERSAEAIFYVSTGLHADSRRSAVVDAWYWLLDHAQQPIASIHLPDGREFRRRLDNLKDKNWWILGTAKQALLEATPTVQAEMLSELAESISCQLPDQLSSELYLSISDWQTLIDAGMQIGAHGVTHQRLSQLTDQALTAEIRGSLKVVQRYSYHARFAFADGAYDQRAIEELRQCAVLSAVTCESGAVSAESELLRLPRLFLTPKM